MEFLPDPNVLGALAQQIKNSHLTYPLFGLARKFLEKHEYHALRLTGVEQDGQPAPELYRVAEPAALTLDRRAADRLAYEAVRTTLFEEKTELGEPPKGNFTNIARCRLDGTLLGPTNHHAYQTSIRALYESRYSRRMNFEQFRREIEVISDPAEVEKWKEQSRSSTTYTVVGTEPPVVLASPADARRYFEEHHLTTAVKAGPSFVLTGPVARENGDAALGRAIQAAWDVESRHPYNLVQLVRAGLQKAGLQIFKHRKKFVYVSGVRPVPFRPDADSVVSPGVRAILDLIGRQPGISRKSLAEQLIGHPPQATESSPVPSAPSPTPAAEPVLAATAASLEESNEHPAEGEPTAAQPEESNANGHSAEGEPTAASSEESDANEHPAEGEPTAAPAAEAPSNVEAPTSVEAASSSGEPTAKVEPPAHIVITPAEEAYARAKSTLVSDLRWLASAGHVIAMFDGTYDLPPTPQARPEPTHAPRKTAATAPVSADAAAPAPAVTDPDSRPEPTRHVEPTEPQSAVTEPQSESVEPVVAVPPAAEPHHDVVDPLGSSDTTLTPVPVPAAPVS